MKTLQSIKEKEEALVLKLVSDIYSNKVPYVSSTILDSFPMGVEHIVRETIKRYKKECL